MKSFIFMIQIIVLISIALCSQIEKENLSQYKINSIFMKNISDLSGKLYYFSEEKLLPIQIFLNGDIEIGADKLTFVKAKSRWQGMYESNTEDVLKKHQGISILYNELWCHYLDKAKFYEQREKLKVSNNENKEINDSEKNSDSKEKRSPSIAEEFNLLIWDHPYKRIGFLPNLNKISTLRHDIEKFLEQNMKCIYTVRSIYIDMCNKKCKTSITKIVFDQINNSFSINDKVHPQLNYKIVAVLNEHEVIAEIGKQYCRIGFYFHNMYESEKICSIPEKDSYATKALCLNEFIHIKQK